VFLSSINCSKRVARTWKVMKEVFVQDLTEPMKVFKRVRYLLHSERHLSINQAHYVEILKRLREAVRRKWSELRPYDWILHHDNAPAHKALSVKQFLA